MITLKRSWWLRRWFEHWLCGRYMVRYGPAMLQRQGYWWYIDHHGKVYRLEPTGAWEGSPLAITLEHN